MGPGGSTEPDHDFEDMLAKFEQSFSQCERGRRLYDHDQKQREIPSLESASTEERDMQPDLHALWKELINHILRYQNKAPLTPTTDETELAGLIFQSGISREVFKAEVRTTLSKLRSLDETRSDITELSSSQQATFRSMKTHLAERTAELEVLKRKHRQVDNAKHRLEETVKHLSSSVANCETNHLPVQDEVKELRDHTVLLKKQCSDLEEATKRFNAERARFQSTIARYREELLLASHQTESAQLEATQAKNRNEDLEKRATEAKASSAAVSARVKELQDVQDAMVQLMKEAKDDSDVPTVRRNLADLGDRRSRLVGRIAHLLTKNKHVGNAGNESTAPDGIPGASNDTSHNNEVTVSSRRIAPQEASVGPINRTGSSSEDAGAPSGPETSTKKPLFEGIRKLGNELTRVGTNRTSRRSLLVNVERSRLAIENDSTLREVIEMKEKEVERLEDELHMAKDKAAALERSLQKERQKHRLENRTISSAPDQQAGRESGSVLASRNKTLFEWQSGVTEKVISPTGINIENQAQHANFMEHSLGTGPVGKRIGNP